MSKDEEIQKLREKLARAEGERDALKEVVRDKVNTAPTPVFPYTPVPSLNRCALCGFYYYGLHTCFTVPAIPYTPLPWYTTPLPWYPPNPGPITWTSITTSGSSSSQSTSLIQPVAEGGQSNLDEGGLHSW